MSFQDLGLRAELLRAVADQGYDRPSPIQAQAIPSVLAGRDLMASAQTGTGKTTAFTLPLLQRLAETPPTAGRRPVRALVLTPTRELAAQVEESVARYGRHLPLRSTAVYGGVNIRPQFNHLRQGVDVLVATPGRLLDHLQQGSADLSRMEILVLDEADRMLDMGFLPTIRRLLAALPAERQNLLFSATFAGEIRRLADGLLHKPVRIRVDADNSAADTVTQRVHPVDRARKGELLAHLIGSNDWRQVLVFTRTKRGADRLSRQLGAAGLTAVAIHGNKSQAARTRALRDFKRGRARVLVATDIAARGLDISALPHVVNFELPHVPEDYVHRIGRTGRAGAAGTALSLVCVDEHKLLRGIERLLRRPIERAMVAGFEPDPDLRPEPLTRPRQSRPRPAPRSQRPPAAQGKGGRRTRGDRRTA